MKIIGRIIMAAVAIILLSVNIPILISGINTVKEAGWTFETFLENTKILISLVNAVFNIAFGLAAALAAISGRVSFWTFVLSVIGIILAVWYCVDGFQKGTMTEFGDIAVLIPNFGMPLLYAVGAVFLKLGRSK